MIMIIKKDYQIISRFYKIQSEDYMISFEYILKILKKYIN